MFKDKRGLSLSIETVLVIILSISVLTVLILFLNSQTGFFSDFIDGMRSKSNVDSVIEGCNSLESTNQKFSYCCEKKEINPGEEGEIFEASCDEFREMDLSSGRIKAMDCLGINC